MASACVARHYLRRALLTFPSGDLNATLNSARLLLCVLSLVSQSTLARRGYHTLGTVHWLLSYSLVPHLPPPFPASSFQSTLAMPAPRKRGGAAAAANEPDTIQSLATPLEQLPVLFGSSQHSVASHRKLINTLHGLFLRCAQVTTLSSNGKSIKLSGERMFGEAFRNAVVYPLGVKKGVEQADRVVKFIGGFVAFAVEHGEQRYASNKLQSYSLTSNADLTVAEAKGEDDEDDFEGPSSRLVSQLLAFLLRGFQAKNKIPRFRCVQLVALMVNSLGEIE